MLQAQASRMQRVHLDDQLQRLRRSPSPRSKHARQEAATTGTGQAQAAAGRGAGQSTTLLVSDADLGLC